MTDPLKSRFEAAGREITPPRNDLARIQSGGRRRRTMRLVTRGSLTISVVIAAVVATQALMPEPGPRREDAAMKTPLNNDCNGEIAYSVSSAESPTYLGIRLSRSDGSNKCWLTREPATSPLWSPDGTMIAFHTDATGTVDVVDLRERQRWTVAPDAVNGLTWSPDSRMLAYTEEGTGGDLFVVPVEGGDPQQLITTGATEMQPTWSPRGDTIAFASDAGEGNGSDIYTVAVDGGTPQPLATGPGHNFGPAWSPDGRHVAFSTTRHDRLSPDDMPYSSEIYIVRSDGTDAKRLTRGDTHKEWPQWSPDGSWIAYLDRCDNDVCGKQSDVALVSPDGTQQRFVTSTRDAESDFAWFPTGNALAYVTRLQRGARADLFVAPAEGGAPIRLSNDPDFEEEMGICPCAERLTRGESEHLAKGERWLGEVLTRAGLSFRNDFRADGGGGHSVPSLRMILWSTNPTRATAREEAERWGYEEIWSGTPYTVFGANRDESPTAYLYWRAGGVDTFAQVDKEPGSQTIADLKLPIREIIRQQETYPYPH